MKTKEYNTYRLVKSEDLNHHGTLFAGRSAEWFVESGFVAATGLIPPHDLICVKIHGMSFNKPVKAGQIVCYTSQIVYAGTTSLFAYIKVTMDADPNFLLVDGFITFVHVNENTRPKAHGIEITAVSEKEIELQQKAIDLKK